MTRTDLIRLAAVFLADRDIRAADDARVAVAKVTPWVDALIAATPDPRDDGLFGILPASTRRAQELWGSVEAWGSETPGTKPTSALIAEPKKRGRKPKATPGSGP